MRDTVYQQDTNQTDIVDFAFTEEVAAVFPDMIRRSVPGYETMVPVTGLMAARAAGDRGLVYDLGCSLGATSLAVLTQNTSQHLRVIGVDNAPAMIEGARAAIADSRAEFQLGDVMDTAVQDADVVIFNLVLQFLKPTDRLPLLRRIQQQMRPGGLILVSEKVTHDDDSLGAFYDNTHLAWKQANGYSALEVSAKRTALENVMRIDTEQDHEARLQEAGFSNIRQWYRCLNWASFAATA